MPNWLPGDGPVDTMARDELCVMLDAIKRDAKDYFELGAVRCRKKLTNGAIVTVSIRMPTQPSSADTKEKP